MWRFFRATVRPHSVNTVRFEHKATKRKRRSTPTSISTEATPAHLRYQPTTVSMSALQLLLAVALLHTLCAPQCHAACVEVDSDTEAVAGQGFKLGCISCKMRGEVPATASVDWYFMAKQGTEFDHIYNYEDETATIMDQRFEDRLDWNGSKKTNDLQDGSIYILNVTYNDSGVYQCLFKRTLTFPFYEFNTNATKIIHINVVAKADLKLLPRVRSSPSSSPSSAAAASPPRVPTAPWVPSASGRRDQGGFDMETHSGGRNGGRGEEESPGSRAALTRLS
ncbi:sodium channel subunit beta-1-like isoform X1 [Arapaima gigas]